MEFAKNINAVFEFTSASSNVGINELFNKLGEKLLKQINDIKQNKGKGITLKSENGSTKKTKNFESCKTYVKMNK